MKKKLVSVLMAGTLAAGMLAGCGSNSGSDTAASTAATEAAAAATEAAADAATESAEEAATEEAPAELDYDGDVKVWVADNVVDFTTEQIKKFQEANPGVANATFTVEPVGEGDAASNMITDVEAGADVYTFAQDQIARLQVL